MTSWLPWKKKTHTLLDKILSYIPVSSKDIHKAFLLIKKLWGLYTVKLLVIIFVLLIVSPIVLFVILRPSPAKSIKYGVNYSKKYAEQLGLDWKQTYLTIIDDLSIKQMRLVVYWDDVEKTQGVYDYSDIEWQLTEAEKRNIKVILAIGRKVPRYPECFEPQWWDNLRDQNVKNEYLYTYIRNTVTHLKKYSAIKIWQVENEPFFPFGDCAKSEYSTVQNEVEIVRGLDSRPILVQDSGEGGFWFPTYLLGDYLGISMYRKIWYDFWKIFFGRFIYFQYPLAHWSYKIKADLVRVPIKDIYITELQAEPWGPGISSSLSNEEKDKTMSKTDFIGTISYAQKAGFENIYFWGAEWWLWEKEKNNNPYYWETARAILRSSE